MYPQFKNLLHNVVKDEDAEDHLTAKDEVIPGGDVSNQFDCPDLVGRDRSARCWKFNHQPEKTQVRLWWMVSARG